MATDWPVPTFADVLAARRRIAAHLRPTPLFSYAALDDLLGTPVHVKHENHQPVGAFKVRGGVNLVAQLSDEERERGLIGASTGNHGQSLAFAARRFSVTARICVPERANPVKLAAMEGLGAELIVQGADFDEARENAERLAAEHGYRYVHSGPVEDECRTSAEGLATRVPFELPQQILRAQLDDFLLVSEEQISAAQRTMIEATRNLVEAAGAAPLAAALERREELRGRRVALVASGGNVSPAQLRELLA